MTHDDHAVMRRALAEQFGLPHDLNVTPDALPAHNPAPLPDLPFARLVGAVERRPIDDFYYQASIFYDHDLDPNALLEELRGALEPLGWHTAPTPFLRRQGFDDAHLPDLPFEHAAPPTLFLHDSARAALRVQHAPERLSLHVETGPAFAHHQGHDDLVSLPRLTLPEHGELHSLGGGSGGSEQHQYADDRALLHGPLSGDAWHAHYARQLEAHGWTLSNTAHASTVLASSWTVPTASGRQTGSLLLHALPSGAWAAHLSTLLELDEPGEASRTRRFGSS